MAELHKEFLDKVRRALVGKKIDNVRWLTDDEQENLYWHYKTLVIELEDGTFLVPMRDDEGNDAGAMATNIKGAETLYVVRS